MTAGNRLAGWFLAMLVVVAVLATRSGSSRPARIYPENAAQARQMITGAERDARAKPDDGEAQFAYGLCLMWLDRKAEARPVLERAEKMLPKMAWPSNALGWLLVNEQDYVDAVPHLQRAVGLDSNYVAAYHNLAWSLARLDRTEEAESVYTRATKLAPDDAALAADYSIALFQERKLDRAMGQIYRAIRLDSANARYHSLAGYFLRSRARFVDARAEFERAAELDPAPAFNWVQVGMTDYLMGDAHGADRAFVEAVKRDSTIFRFPELRTMAEEAKKGRTVPVQAESVIQFRLDSAPSGG